MGNALSCLPCVSPASARFGNPDDFPSEPPRSKTGVFVSETALSSRASASASSAAFSPRTETTSKGNDFGAGLSPEPSARSSSSVGFNPKEPEPAALDASFGFGSSLTEVLRDKQMTTLTILTSTVVGSLVGVVTMSGAMGSVAYLTLLVVQVVCATLARVLTQKNAPASSSVRSLPPPPQRKASQAKAPPLAANPKAPAAPATEAPAPNEWAIEPRTKHKYSAVMDEHDGYPRELEVLCGLGIREKKVFALAIDIYSAGLYVNAAQFNHAFGAKYGELAREAFVGKSEDVFEDVIRSTELVGRTIRLVIQFSGLTPKMLVGAFDERLERPMKAQGASEVYEQLRGGLGSIKLYPGRVILLRMKTDGTLLATSGRETLAECRSHVLCQAVTDIYLGGDSPTPSLKADAATRMYDAIRSPRLGGGGVPSQQAPAAAAAAAEATAQEESQEAADAEDLSGTWEVVEAENVEEFLVTLGISFLVRKIAVRLYEHDMKIMVQEGKSVSFTDYRNKKKGDPVWFRENKVVHRKDKQGRALEDVASWDGTCLLIKTEGYKDTLFSRYWRDSRDTMISETTTRGVTMRRKWKIMDQAS